MHWMLRVIFSHLLVQTFEGIGIYQDYPPHNQQLVAGPFGTSVDSVDWFSLLLESKTWILLYGLGCSKSIVPRRYWRLLLVFRQLPTNYGH